MSVASSPLWRPGQTGANTFRPPLPQCQTSHQPPQINQHLNQPLLPPDQPRGGHLGQASGCAGGQCGSGASACNAGLKEVWGGLGLIEGGCSVCSAAGLRQTWCKIRKHGLHFSVRHQLKSRQTEDHVDGGGVVSILSGHLCL